MDDEKILKMRMKLANAQEKYNKLEQEIAPLQVKVNQLEAELAALIRNRDYARGRIEKLTAMIREAL